MILVFDPKKEVSGHSVILFVLVVLDNDKCGQGDNERLRFIL